jgi:hypothetical protein
MCIFATILRLVHAALSELSSKNPLTSATYPLISPPRSESRGALPETAGEPENRKFKKLVDRLREPANVLARPENRTVARNEKNARI